MVSHDCTSSNSGNSDGRVHHLNSRTVISPGSIVITLKTGKYHNIGTLDQITL